MWKTLLVVTGFIRFITKTVVHNTLKTKTRNHSPQTYCHRFAAFGIVINAIRQLTQAAIRFHGFAAWRTPDSQALDSRMTDS